MYMYEPEGRRAAFDGGINNSGTHNPTTIQQAPKVFRPPLQDVVPSLPNSNGQSLGNFKLDNTEAYYQRSINSPNSAWGAPGSGTMNV